MQEAIAPIALCTHALKLQTIRMIKYEKYPKTILSQIR